MRAWHAIWEKNRARYSSVEVSTRRMDVKRDLAKKWACCSWRDVDRVIGHPRKLSFVVVRVVCVCKSNMCILDLLLHSKESLFTDNRLWCILSLWPQFVHLTRQNVFSVTLLGIPSITCTWPAFCLYSQAADVSRVCFSSFFLVRKIVNLLFYFSEFDICKIVYSFQLAKNLFLEGCRVERREATSMSFSKRGHGWWC